MSTHRTIAVTLSTAALLGSVAIAAAPSAAAAPVGPPAAAAVAGSGGTVTGPTPVPAPSSDLAAGEVCSFGVHLSFPYNRQEQWTYTDASGRVVAEYVQGALTGVITRTDTGKSVTRDLSGRGVFTYASDGSSTLTGYGAALVGFHAGDTPSHQLLKLSSTGFAQIHFAADGRRTLVYGSGEDLCRTLA